jgi:hypothetical protein
MNWTAVLIQSDRTRTTKTPVYPKFTLRFDPMLSMAEATLRHRMQDIMQNTGMLYWKRKGVKNAETKAAYDSNGILVKIVLLLLFSYKY